MEGVMATDDELIRHLEGYVEERTLATEGYVNGRATKYAIVARAAEAFAQQGFHGASVRGIAKAAGVDHSTLLHHFGNKTALLLAVLDWQDAQHLPADVAAMVSSAEEVAAGFVATAERNRAVPGLVRLLSVMTAEAGSPGHPAREPLQRRQHIPRDVIAATIRAQRLAGAVEDDGLTPEQAAALVIATWEGLQTYDALHPGELDVPDLLGRTLRRAFGLA
jgi:AcrR family transcriptional regulator